MSLVETYLPQPVFVFSIQCVTPRSRLRVLLHCADNTYNFGVFVSVSRLICSQRLYCECLKSMRSRKVQRAVGQESRLLNLNPVMRMVRAYLCRFVPSISVSCNSGYNRLHGTQFAKGLAGRFCLRGVHLVLVGSFLSGSRGG